MRQIYEVNRLTVEAGAKGEPGRHRDPGRDPARPARGGAPGREAADGRRRGLPRRRAVRGGRPQVRRGHVRGADGAGVRALREGHPREADLPRGPPIARPRPPEPPYDVTAWSLGMLLGVEHAVVSAPDRRRRAAREADRGAEESRGGSRATARGSCSTTAGRTRRRRSTRCCKQGARATMELGDDRRRGWRSPT